MAWGDLAAVGKLMASLSQLSSDGGWQTKGAGRKGKGDSKGKGKGKYSKATQSDDNCSQCMWEDCSAAVGHKVTWDKPCCHSCGRPKGVSKSPPLERLVAWAYEERCKLANTKGTGKGQANKDDKGKNKAATTPPPRTQAAVADAEELSERRAERLAGLKAAASADPSLPSSSGSAATPPAQAAKPPGKKAASVLCESALDSAPLILELIQPVIDLVAADWIAEVPVGLNADEALKTLLQSSDHLSVADGRDALETCLAESRKLLETATSPTLKQCLQAQINSDTAALEKLAKKSTPSLATQLAALQEAEKRILTSTSERKDKEDKGRQKARERGDARREFFADVRQQLTFVENAVATHEEQWASVHEAKSQVLNFHGITMLAKLHTRIAAAENPVEPTGTPPTTSSPPTPPPKAGRDVEMKTLQDSLSASEATAKAAAEAVAQARATAEEAATEAANTQSGLLQRIQALQETAKQAEALQLMARASQQAELTFPEADFDMVPTEVTPKTGTKTFLKICGHLFQVLEKWHYGGTFSVTLDELSKNSLAKDATQDLLKKLLGKELWKGWFGDEDFLIVDGSSVLPRQALMFLHYALRQLKEQYEAVEETRTAAAKSFAQLLEASAKKRRVLD